MLHLPYMAELVRDKVVVGKQGAGADQDRAVERVAVEAAEPRETKERRHDEEADAAERDRARIEVEQVEPSLGAAERLTLLGIHAPTL